MKKTVFSIITALFFVFILSLSAYADSAPCIEVSSACVDDGDKAEISIGIKNNPGISTMYIKVDFAYPLQLIKAESSGLFNNPLFSENNSDGYCVLSWDDSLSNTDNVKDGALARLEFFVPENTPDGIYEISISYDTEEIYNSKLNNVSFEVKNGSVTVGNNKFKEYRNTLLINEDFTVEGLLAEKKDAVEILSDGKKLTSSEKIKSGDEILLSDGRKINIVFLGDINSDGKISAQDARIALRNSVELEELNEWQKVAANTDFEKNVTAKDARMILRASVELENSSEWFMGLNSSMVTASKELSSLSEDSKAIGEFIKAGVENFDKSIDLSGYDVSKKLLESIIKEYIHYVPSFFYVKSVYLCYVGNTITGLELVYMDDAESKLQEYKALLNDITALCNKDMTDAEIALFYHDYICENFSYDNTLSVFDAYTMLKEKTGVCQAYSLLYMDILDKFGIDSVYVQSDVLNHGWTLIKIGGSWYHVDVTWDDPINDRLGRVRHDYFLLSDSAIKAQKHKLWEAIGESEECKNTKYDNAFWHNVDTSIVKNGRFWYYIGKYEDHYAIFETSLTDGGKVIYELNDKWKFGLNSYWNGYYSGFAVFCGRLVYNTSDSIRAYSLTDGSCVTLYKFDEKKSVYGFTLNGDVIRCNLNTTPDEKMNDIREITLALTGDANSDKHINAKDYTVLIRYVNNMLSEINTACADYNYDGKIDADDAKALRYALVNR